MPPKGGKSLSKKRDIHAQEALEEIFRESDSEVLDFLDSGSEYSLDSTDEEMFLEGKDPLLDRAEIWTLMNSGSQHPRRHTPIPQHPIQDQRQPPLAHVGEGISSMLLRLYWETQQTVLQRNLQMSHPGGAGLPVQPEWAAGTTSCYQ
ncbi:hypothetical protein UPYG_G00055020 [Umbra pygmaea]|uniref:Uncharacterized protein n=1 Tax=Umbra pygmaea TaxID=75934 RepID=A0ABD0X818_UMBPY